MTIRGRHPAALFLALLCLGLTGCAAHTSGADDAVTIRLAKRLKAVRVGDGISRTEAEIIGRSYFIKNFGCGTYQGINDGGDRWVVEAGVLATALPVKGFYIEKRSGRIVSPIGPSYEDPHQIFP